MIPTPTQGQSKWGTPTTCFDHATLVYCRFSMQLFFETVLGKTFFAICFSTPSKPPGSWPITNSGAMRASAHRSKRELPVLCTSSSDEASSRPT